MNTLPVESIPFYGSDAYTKGLSRCTFQNPDLRDQLRMNANEAMHDLSRSHGMQAMVTIPVAAHEEGQFIGDTLRTYATQRAAPPFGLALSINYPTGADRQQVARTKDAIFDFTDDFPEVPLTYLEKEYTVGTPIGEIRRDIVNATIGGVALYSFGLKPIPRTFQIVNADADTRHLSKYYMKGMHEVSARQPYPELTFTYPSIRNSRSNGRFPNMDVVVAWDDFLNHHAERYADSHIAMGLGTYFAADGYAARSAFGETTELLERSRDAVGDALSVLFVPNALATVSARHAYAQLQHGEEVHFEPVRSESGGSYRTEEATGPDIDQGATWRYMDMARMDRLPLVVGAQRQKVREAGTEAGVTVSLQEATATAKERTLLVTTKALGLLGASPQIAKAVERQMTL